MTLRDSPLVVAEKLLKGFDIAIHLRQVRQDLRGWLGKNKEYIDREIPISTSCCTRRPMPCLPAPRSSSGHADAETRQRIIALAKAREWST